jgi:transcriptional regulator with PAS, ATPase and Fis domain
MDYVREQSLAISDIKLVRTEDAVDEARVSIEDGARVIVALGQQARLIKENSKVPVVEIRLHAQEIGLLLMQAKAMVNRSEPKVGLIAFDNMLCDMSHMEELFGVSLSILYMDKIEMIPQKLAEMAKKEPDIIIGGEMTCQEAEKMGYPNLHFRATQESVSEALRTAQKMADAVELKMQYAAQFETVLDTSFSGIIKVNLEGKIIVVNKAVENLIGKDSEDVIGLFVGDVFPEIDIKALNRILQGERDDYIVSVTLRNQAWTLMMAPIQYDEQITGAILSLHRASSSGQKDSKVQRDMLLQGYTASVTFRQIPTENQQMKEILERAKEYALSDSPVLICGEEGTEYYMIAEAMHNNSMRKDGPFISFSAMGMEKELQMQILFGGENVNEDVQSRKNAIFARANHGTIFIKEIEHLTMQAQYQLCRTLASHTFTKTNVQPIRNLDVRVIVFSRENLHHLVKTGKVSEELYYLLSGLTLDIPGLNQRPEDLVYYFDKFVGEYSQKYKKRIVIADTVYAKIRKLSWKGNLIQLKSFCERLVLTAEKRRIDEGRVQNLYAKLYPHIREMEGDEQVVVYKSPEAAEVSAVLEKHRGNRTLAAKELGISTTTLWRRMKKYGIEIDRR